MTTLSTNLENRVRKLPKPSNATQALQPLFEAISNAFFAIEDAYGHDEIGKGRVSIAIENLGSGKKIDIQVSDNGIGLDHIRFGAFCTIDTDFKRSKGGKGVGRLFWLDAFQKIEVSSQYKNSDRYLKRHFSFQLKNSEQIVSAQTDVDSLPGVTGTTIHFTGLRGTDYQNNFPKRVDTFIRYFSAHFIADFLVGNGPEVEITMNNEVFSFPKQRHGWGPGTPLERGAPCLTPLGGA